VDTVPPEVAEARRGFGAAPKASQSGSEGSGVLVVWRIQGTVNLPWHPTIKPYYGATLYELQPQLVDYALALNEDGGGGGGLVSRATEWWSVHADAFLAAVAPEAAAHVFGTEAAQPAPVLRLQGLPALLEQLHGFPRSLAATATEMDNWQEVLREETSP